jgi:malate dehydrogenase (quinone)
MTSAISDTTDVLLIGAGIMSATFGVLLKELEPSLNITMVEALEDCALESSQAWNNAGTGHAANCEINYTPERPDGSIDISKALQVNVEFDLSRQLWSYLVKQGAVTDPQTFIHPVPHLSFVRGAENVSFLKRRSAAMSAHHCYRGMEYTENHQKIAEWAPLIMEGRPADEQVAATRIITGTDVDYGALTHHLVDRLVSQPGFAVHYRHRVTHITREPDARWLVKMEDFQTGAQYAVKAKFVFIGAGGGALPLLQRSGIPEGRGYGGFPVSGIWLRCDNTDISNRHHAKVYGKAAVGSPPMSVPHLDTRIIGGQRSLLFGPYAGFSSKFLKHGSLLDLFESVEVSNVIPLLSVARDNIPLTEYLVEQLLQTPHHRLAMLKEYYPAAPAKDWQMAVAGQRVQIIKPDQVKGGLLEFGTELVAAADRSLVALLGASPGASTAAFIAISVLEKCFANELTASAWLPRLKAIIPSYGVSLIDDADLCQRIRAETADVLKIQHI